MSNPFFKAPSSPTMMGNPLQMVNAFRQFAANMTPQKAEAEVNKLLNSGRMSTQQFEDLKKQAQAFAQFLK